MSSFFSEGIRRSTSKSFAGVHKLFIVKLQFVIDFLWEMWYNISVKETRQ